MIDKSNNNVYTNRTYEEPFDLISIGIETCIFSTLTKYGSLMKKKKEDSLLL